MGFFKSRRTVPGNVQVTTAWVAGPDRWAQQAASLGAVTNTYSPASVGMHSHGSAKGFIGDRGYGTNGNRWAGRTTYPWQTIGAQLVPVAQPRSKRLGIGAGAAGQPGLPNTGSATGGLSSIAWLSYNPLGRTGLGG